MRLVFLIAGGLAVGAASAGGLQVVLPQNGAMFDAVRALGGNPASVKIGEINPLKAYEDVRRQIASGSYRAPFDVGGSTPVTSFPNIGRISLNNNLRMDEVAMKRAIAAGVNAQVQQSIRRSRDLAAYARNPAWRGVPPLLFDRSRTFAR
jgi:hypothetical protein